MSNATLIAFRQVIDNLTAFSVIYADQNAPREALPYCAIRFMNNRGTEFVEIMPTGADGNRQIVENQTDTVELNFYGSSAITEAEKVRRQLQFENTMESLGSAGLAIQDRGTVTNLTALLNNSQYEQRAMFEVMVAWRSVETENVGIVEDVVIAGLFDRPAEDDETVSFAGEIVVESTLQE